MAKPVYKMIQGNLDTITQLVNAEGMSGWKPIQIGSVVIPHVVAGITTSRLNFESRSKIKNVRLQR